MISSAKYSKIHLWISKNYGKAHFCENIACRKISSRYEWAKLKDKEYEFNRENFIQLCRSCHAQYDFKPAKFNKINRFNPKSTIQKLRLLLGLNHRAFANKIEVDPSTVLNWEAGRRSPRLPKIRKMLELAKKHKIKISVEDFLPKGYEHDGNNKAGG